MNIRLSSNWSLTTEHAASSYGQPVPVSRSTGRAYGSADIVPEYTHWVRMPAAHVARVLARVAYLTSEERRFVGQFTA